MKKLGILALALMTTFGSSPENANARGNFFSRSQSIAGPEYNFKHFENLSLADFKLQMSVSEATEIIARDHWKGGWFQSDTPAPKTIETTTFPFKKDNNSSIALYRYRRSDDNGLYIYAIDFELDFEEDQDIKILTGKLIEKYGPPTNTATDDGNIILQYSPNSKMYEEQECKYSYKQNPLGCKDYINWRIGPKMTIKVSTNSIIISLEDQKEALLHKNNIETKEKVYNNQNQENNAEDLDLDF